jgi:multidrug efflux pump subunit AcrA (membrane-fusion protein)
MVAKRSAVRYTVAMRVQTAVSLVVALGMAVTAGVVSGGCKPQAAESKTGAAPAAAPTPPPVPVTVTPIRSETLQRKVTVVGSLFADEEVALAAEVEGKVIARMTDVGQTVAPGALLARIDPTDYEIKVRQARNDLAETLSKLDLKDPKQLDTLDVTTLPQVRAARADTRQADAELVNARSSTRAAEGDVTSTAADSVNAEIKLKDAQRNRQSGAATLEEVQDRQTTFESAKAKRDSAVARLEAAKAKEQSALAKVDASKAREEVVVTEAKSMVAEARRKIAVVDNAERDLRLTEVYAPKFDAPALADADAAATVPGAAPRPASERKYFVTARNVEAGDYSKVANVLFKLMITDPLRLRVPVPERFDSQIQRGQSVELYVDSYPGVPFPGKVSRKNVIDQVNRSFEVEVLVPNPETKLKPGGFARAEILTRTDADVLMVPQESVSNFAGINKIFVLEETTGSAPTAREVQVRLGSAKQIARPDGGLERYVEVRPLDAKDTLRAGQPVITSGLARLANGTVVEVKKDKEPQKPAA